ncbi:unnamed protein product [Tenebrio molitor]|nr:unnamed protein product [Tenebrio molitor]
MFVISLYNLHRELTPTNFILFFANIFLRLLAFTCSSLICCCHIKQIFVIYSCHAIVNHPVFIY